MKITVDLVQVGRGFVLKDESGQDIDIAKTPNEVKTIMGDYGKKKAQEMLAQQDFPGGEQAE